MFAVQQLYISQKKFSKRENTISQSLIEKNSNNISKNKETIKLKPSYDLSALMQLQIEQVKKYNAVFIFQSNVYLRYKIV